MTQPISRPPIGTVARALGNIGAAWGIVVTLLLSNFLLAQELHGPAGQPGPVIRLAAAAALARDAARPQR